MKTSIAAFRFSLVGFTLPFMFVYRPALCLLAPEGEVLTVCCNPCGDGRGVDPAARIRFSRLCQA